MWFYAAVFAMGIMLCGNPASEVAIVEEPTRLGGELRESFEG